MLIKQLKFFLKRLQFNGEESEGDYTLLTSQITRVLSS